MAKAAEKAQEEDRSLDPPLREMMARLSRYAFGFDELFKIIEEHEK